MKPRPAGFLAHLYTDGASSQDAEVGDYIAELHAYLWGFVRRMQPWASGRLDQYLPAVTAVRARGVSLVEAMQTQPQMLWRREEIVAWLRAHAADVPEVP